MWSLRLGLPSPPYTRRNAIIVETIGRRSGKRRRVPVGFLEEDGKLIVVAEDGLASWWVRNALDREVVCVSSSAGIGATPGWSLGQATLEVYLRRMNRTHAAFVRMESSSPELIEITPE